LKSSNHRGKGIFVAATIAILVLGFLPTAIRPASAATPASTGLIVPLYAYPTDPSWSALIQAKEAYPNVPIIAVVNPDSGPGSSPNSNYVSGIASLKDAGITVVGYIATDYASVSLSTVEASISDYKSWYNVNGVFFDEMSNSQSESGYYSSATDYAYSIGLGLTVGNPGTSVPSNYVYTVNIIVLYESPGLPSASTIASSAMGYASSNFAVMAYDVGLPSQSYIQDLAPYVSYVYFTDGQAPNPYPGIVASYLDDLTAMLSSMGGGSGTLTVQSANLSGVAITGLYTVVSSTSGEVLQTGFTPLTFSGVVGDQYVVSISNYGSDVFSDWSSGSTSAVQTVTLGDSTVETAYYSTGSTPSTYPIDVNSYSLSGSTITGLWVEVQSSSGAVLATGFTPFSYTGTAGSTYSVSVGSYGSDVFSEWSNGSTDHTYTLTLSQATTLDADYST
jgi:hypothetical protein